MTPETIKFLGNTEKKKLNIVKNGLHLEIAEVVLVHCNVIENVY